MIKRVISVALALMLMVACMAGLTVSADEVSFNATLGYANSDWSAQEWGENANTTVTGDGSYSVSWDGAGTDALVFVIDIAGAQAALNETNQTYNVTALSVTVDGTEVPVDLSKIVTGDIEENGNFRIEIYNEYGSTKEDAPIDPAAVAFASNITVNFTIETIDKPVEGYSAFLMFTDVNWAFGNWDDALANTVVNGAGTYTVTLNAADVGGDGATGCVGANVFCVDIIGANAALLEEGKSLSVTDLKIIADGSEVQIDKSLIHTGDIEENGNFRIELHNAYGLTADSPAMDWENFTFAQTLSVEFTIEVVDAESGEVVEPAPSEPEVLEFDPNGTYNAYLQLQTPNWTYRDPWNSANGIGSEYWGDFIYGNETSEKYGKVTDVVIEGNGTYTISITDFGTIFADDFAAAGQEYFNIIGITTDIPLNDTIQITDVKLIVDGATKHTQATYYQNPDTTDYVQPLIQNKWNPDVAEISYYPTPTTSLEIQFTVSGFAYDKAADEVTDEPADEPGTSETEPAPSEPADTTEPASNNTGLIIAIVAVVVVAVVVVIVIKKKKA